MRVSCLCSVPGRQSRDGGTVVLFAKPQRVIERMRRVCREGRNGREAVVECRRYMKGELPLRTWDVTAHLGPDSVGLLARFAPAPHQSAERYICHHQASYQPMFIPLIIRALQRDKKVRAVFATAIEIMRLFGTRSLDMG